jgi:hypothetical protein
MGLVAPDHIVLKLFHVVFNPWVFAGLVTFVISMASHLFVLSKVELSFAYPFLSLAYVAVAVFAFCCFARTSMPGASPGSPSSASAPC